MEKPDLLRLSSVTDQKVGGVEVLCVSATVQVLVVSGNKVWRVSDKQAGEERHAQSQIWWVSMSEKPLGYGAVKGDLEAFTSFLTF